PVPVGAALGHACLTPPAVHTVQTHPRFFFKTMRGQPQISSPSLCGAGGDLGLDSLTMSGLVPDQFNSKPSLAGCVASWRACAVSPWVLRTITKGYVLQFARPPPPFGGVIQSVVQQGQSHFLREEIVSLLRKRSDKCSASRGGSFRLLQPLLPGPQKGRELSANTRSTCVEQSTHAAKVQNADPTPASAVHKTKRLVYHDRLKRCIFPRSDPPQTSKISEVCIRRNSVPIQRTPIRPSSGAEGIHSVRRGIYLRMTSTRLARIQFFGRLVNSCSFRGRSGAGWPSSGGTPASTGLCCKQRETRSLHQASDAFSGYDLRLHLHGGQAVSRTDKCHQSMRAPVPTGTVSLVAALPT